MILVPKVDLTQPHEGLGWFPAGYKDQRTALMKCPLGHIGDLSDHEIAADGTVTPSVQCGHLACTFHDFVVLQDWKT